MRYTHTKGKGRSMTTLQDISKKFSEIIEKHLDISSGISTIYENEARNMVQRECGEDPDYIVTLLAEVIRTDIEHHMPEYKDVYTHIILYALDQVDFEDIARPFVNDALYDAQGDAEVKETDENHKEILDCVA